MKKLFFEHKFEYLDHAGMEKMLSSELGEKLLELARNISVCLHEDWKSNLVREKGLDYQHFRPVKDAELEKEIIEHKDEYLKKMSDDGKPLYRIVESEGEGGQKVYNAQFDLIRVPFEELSQKWQDANLDAAKFALCLVKTCLDQGGLNGEPGEIFTNFEKMAHDVHIEWIYREGGWADPKLLLPYELLTVDTIGNNQKEKDRAHVKLTTKELTFQPNILQRNRSIVLRAIRELFGAHLGTIKNESGEDIFTLDPKIFDKLTKDIKKFVDRQNEVDFARYETVKAVVIQKAKEILNGKTELSFDDLEKLSATYFAEWKRHVQAIYELPQELSELYKNLGVDDVKVNHKTVAREEVVEILKEMVSKNELSQELGNSIGSVFDEKSSLGKIVKKCNEEDYANYIAKINGGSQPGEE